MRINFLYKFQHENLSYKLDELEKNLFFIQELLNLSDCPSNLIILFSSSREYSSHKMRIKNLFIETKNFSLKAGRKEDSLKRLKDDYIAFRTRVK
jgi:hypothetical protein